MEVEVLEETEIELLQNNVTTKKDVSTDKIVMKVKFEGIYFVNWKSRVKNHS